MDADQVADNRMWQNPGAVTTWLRRAGHTVVPPLTITRAGFGQSNITTLIADACGREWVMREPPPGPAAATAHDIGREAGILRRLSDTGIPVPVVVGTGQSPSGATFLVMKRVSGAALECEEDALNLSEPLRHQLGISVAETLGRLHRLNPYILGLRRSRTPYLKRQLGRIGESWEHVGRGTPHDSEWQRVRATLIELLPAPGPQVIMHGDYRLSNLLVADGAITAVLDWELCTVGDAMADLAWLLDDWRAPDEEQIVMPSPTRAGAFPSRAEMIETYCRTSGLAPVKLDYHRAFSQWRAASLLQGVLARRRRGALGSHGAIDADAVTHSIGTLLRSAADHLDCID